MQTDLLIEGMLRFKSALRRERRQKLLVLAIALSLTLGLAYMAGHMPETRQGAFFAILALLGLLASLWLIRDLRQHWQPEQHPIYRLLHQQGERVVWIYTRRPLKPLLNPNFWPEIALFIGLDQGELLDLRLKPEDETSVLQALAELLPQASFGYTSERAQWFAANPLLLLREEGD